MEARRKRRHRNSKYILLAGLVIAVAVFVGTFLLLKSRGGGDAAADRQVRGEGSGNVIVTGRTGNGAIDQLLMIVPKGDEGTAIYTIPARTVAETPGQGFQRLDRAFELGGQELLDQTVADLLQVPIQYHIAYTGDVIDLAVEHAGTIDFKSSRTLTLNTAGGPVELKAGDNTAGKELALSWYRSALSDRQAGPEVAALFFRGLREALAARPENDRDLFAGQLAGRLDTDLDRGDLIDLFMEITAPGTRTGIWGLPVTPAGGGDSWYFEPELKQIDIMMTGSPADAGFDVEIQNGTGTPGVVEAAGQRLSSLHYNLSLDTAPSGVNYDFTQIRTGSEALTEGANIHDLLGTGTLIKDDNLQKRQIIVIIGRDLDLNQLERR